MADAAAQAASAATELSPEALAAANAQWAAIMEAYQQPGKAGAASAASSPFVGSAMPFPFGQASAGPHMCGAGGGPDATAPADPAPPPWLQMLFPNPVLQQMYGAFNPFAVLTGVNPEAAEGEAKAGSAEGTTQVWWLSGCGRGRKKARELPVSS